jgi:hypothetical protein
MCVLSEAQKKPVSIQVYWAVIGGAKIWLGFSAWRRSAAKAGN